ncbi:MAG: CBS domain-containing protein [Nitrososphaeraceae archaeon]|jgi:CBS domain-containing protein
MSLDLSTPVSKFMTKTVITATLDQTIQTVCKIMYENNIGSVVIVKREVDGFLPIGIITERDITHALGSVELFPTQTPLRELMSTNVISIKPDSSIHDAVAIMHGNNIRRLPVINDDGKMVGIITDKHILGAIAGKNPNATAFMPKEFQTEE